ncbi:thioredoxin family protein [Thalassotalea euphylliae]|uniref:Thioredoxin n=1 Tax=Thalassotalea euphylliae TaxID=1655234 RepID=A0A3E0TZY7_9GAMM|nr:thioredoxin domain-containing protein [Thalassotalea euphylliae]REL29943.1 thiol reductase thioredoxin [Thalassotalea euphylliae]
MAAIEVTDIDHFAELIANNDKIVIDFWAPWCAPCRAMMPVFEKVFSGDAIEATGVKANVDELPVLAQKFGIRSIPAIIVIENGEVKTQSSGLMNEQALRDLVA